MVDERKITKVLAYKTSVACPEQWELYDSDTGEQIACMRLRHGIFRVDVLKCGGETIYRAEVGDDAGCFSKEERKHYLTEACEAIAKYYGWRYEGEELGW